jgi:hypothetical protein
MSLKKNSSLVFDSYGVHGKPPCSFRTFLRALNLVGTPRCGVCSIICLNHLEFPLLCLGLTFRQITRIVRRLSTSFQSCCAGGRRWTVAKAKKARRGTVRGKSKESIFRELKVAGKAGITIKELAVKTGVKTARQS